MHGCNRSRSTRTDGCRNGTVQVKGYRRANGTYVAGYTRSLPRKSSFTTMPTASQAKSRASTQVVFKRFLQQQVQGDVQVEKQFM